MRLIDTLTKTSKKFVKEHKDIIDIILFGSVIRGKKNPSDIDIMILFDKKIDKNAEYEFRKKIKENASVISKTTDSVNEYSFDAKEGLLFEGYSLVNSRFLSSNNGFSSLGIFIYETKKMSNTNRTKFYYALNGRRGSNGVLKDLNAIKLSDNIIGIPLDMIETAKDFFSLWKIEYKYIPALIPERLNKRKIIEKVR
ncbi:MAG: nucleotidyltransferase domain-containing protein [Candidatus Woesearchaeota archaeon]